MENHCEGPPKWSRAFDKNNKNQPKGYQSEPRDVAQNLFGNRIETNDENNTNVVLLLSQKSIINQSNKSSDK